MARPLKAERTIRQEIYFREGVHRKLEILLYSPTEGRVPHGVWSEFINQIVERALAHPPQLPTLDPFSTWRKA